MNTETSVSFVGLAWIALIVLKALNHLTWGWALTILFPIWFPIAATLAILALALVACIVIAIVLMVAGTILYFLGVK